MVKFEGKFNDDIQKRASKKAYKKVIFIYALMGLLFIGLGIFFIEDNLYLGEFYILLGLLFVPIAFLIRKLQNRNISRTTAIMSDETIMRFAFDEKQIYIQHFKDNEYRSAIEAKYSYLFKVIKTKNEYLVYVSMYNMHVIPFSDLKEGTLDELDSYFKNNLEAKFKTK